jgi:uncharacterized protein
MPQPVVHLEIIGRDPERLHAFYGELFGWDFDTSAPIAAEVSESGRYGFTNDSAGDSGLPAGIGGGPDHAPHILFYVGVEDIGATLDKAERLGATRVLDPQDVEGRELAIGQFTDPEGNLVGLARLRNE